jgi:hypothetical protein
VKGTHVAPAAAGELRELVEQERAARERAEYTASELARIVATELRRGETERMRREQAEAQVQEMARMVAFEYSRAEEAEARLRDLGY